MSATVDKRPEANTLYIGEGVTIKGAVVVASAMIIDGQIEGEISVGNLLVNEKGTVRGRINVAQDAEIFGNVVERLDVKGLLTLRSTSRVDGIVSCGNLKIEQGANFTGGISSVADRAVRRPAKSDRKHDGRLNNNAAPTLQPIELSSVEVVPLPSPFAASA
jgi:cytoskeletal protein CcmA (bactofilin family)